MGFWMSASGPNVRFGCVCKLLSVWCEYVEKGGVGEGGGRGWGVWCGERGTGTRGEGGEGRGGGQQGLQKGEESALGTPQ